MKLIQLIRCNLKRIMKSKSYILLSFVLPAVAIGVVTIINNMDKSSGRTYYMVNNDSGVYGREFIKELSKDYNIKLYQKDEATEKLKKKSIADFYEIDQDFSQVLMKGKKPQIKVNRRESSNEFSDFEMRAEELVNKLVLSSLIERNSGEKIALSSLENKEVHIKINAEKKTGFGSQMVISFLISFNLFCAIGMCYELFGLKHERTLKRSLTTGNKPRTIIGAVLGAQFILILIGYIALLFGFIFLNDITMLSQVPIIILNLIMTTAVGLSLAVFVSRIIKDEKLIAVVLQIILCSTCFIGGSFIPVEMLPKSISFFSRITPQYWAMQSIRDGRFEYSFIVLLFAVVLFTAGTLSTRSFAE